ncbi:hypothetical protein CEXT_44691 [Caerostris extrusa]|uniref:Uncharacterized protein n=1 Tax=Caerostris extrusa TaxID=172846 RepID=A0AAV4TUN1_CAEEX|nr:hypothetical protein CEXT_44691 [Caerostris extrusa]
MIKIVHRPGIELREAARGRRAFHHNGKPTMGASSRVIEPTARGRALKFRCKYRSSSWGKDKNLATAVGNLKLGPPSWQVEHFSPTRTTAMLHPRGVSTLKLHRERGHSASDNRPSSSWRKMYKIASP